MGFVWSDDLAMLLVTEDGKERSELAHWLARPVAYRLPDDLSVLSFARKTLEQEHSLHRVNRRAS
ncbi:MAG: hypothetical protein HKO76_07965 [Acidimicrobiia bacterium]|nr:hypothetical protein [Acidimicrobiia bacterium]